MEQTSVEPNALVRLNPARAQNQNVSESASSILDAVPTMFPGVGRGPLLQIIENRFKPTKIYSLLASEKERAETHKTINIGCAEFKEAEREGNESEYRMTSFFTAWAFHTGILIKLAPHGLQGEPAIGLCIYTINLYELLGMYT